MTPAITQLSRREKVIYRATIGIICAVAEATDLARAQLRSADSRDYRLREKLRQSISHWQTLARHDVRTMASWEGAILRMKVERSPAALDRSKNIVFQTVFSKAHSRSRKSTSVLMLYCPK